MVWVYNTTLLCIISYAVFVLGYSGWWFLLMLVLSGSSEGNEAGRDE